MSSMALYHSVKKLNVLLVAGGLIFLFITMTGCSSLKKSNCGCPSKKGMVGY